jgi:hypothetical protein
MSAYDRNEANVGDEGSFQAVGPLSAATPVFSAPRGILNEIANILGQSNGFALWGGAFIFLPSGSADDVPTIEEFNGHAWKGIYQDDVRRTVFFAMDVFGFPFGVLDNNIVWMNPETGELHRITKSVRRFLEMVNTEPEHMIGFQAHVDWFDRGQTYEIGQRLAPKVPFVLGGGKSIADFYATDIIERADFNAFIYAKTKNMPDRTRIKFEDAD